MSDHSSLPATPPHPHPHRRGRLYLVPNALDLGTAAGSGLLAVLPAGALEVSSRLQYWIVENAKSARAFLKRVDADFALHQTLQSLTMVEMVPAPKGQNADSAAAAQARIRSWLQPALDGHDIGLLSEAGLPAVADPGAAVVRAAHLLDLPVIALSGPSSITLALAASGLQGQSFAFVGYVPTEAQARAKRIQELESHSRKWQQTQLAIETPYRNAALWQALLAHLSPQTWLSVSCGLTLADGYSRTQTVAHWRQHPLELPKTIPAVFVWLAP